MAKTLNLSFSILLLLSPLLQETHADEHDLVRTSCLHASYPEICLRSLSSCGGYASTPRDLAVAAVRVSIGRVRKASDFLSNLKRIARRERGALADCVEQMGDSVDELGKTLSALNSLRRGGDFRWQMSNAETWVSAALSNEETCLDGFKDIGGDVRSDVRRSITNVARVTSNALYLINLIPDNRR